MKTTIITVLALLIGAASGSAFTAHRNAAELEKRAHHARALFRVVERSLGHDRAIAEWRAEAAKAAVVSP